MMTFTIGSGARGEERRGRPGGILLWVLVGALSFGVSAAYADSLVPPGKAPPELVLPDLDGITRGLDQLKGRVVLLLFGELYNPNTVEACKDVSDVLDDPTLEGIDRSAFLIVTQHASASDLRADAKQKGIELPILHDAGRAAFAAYRVIVLPSLVVVDGEGITVLPCAGYPLDFKDMLLDAVAYAGGKLSLQEFQVRRETKKLPEMSAESARAARLAALGEQLARRGSEELAKFRQAVEIDPGCIPARIGLGTSLLRRRELTEAEKQFLFVLEAEPTSVEGALGLVHVEVTRGGEELKSADSRLRKLMDRRPNDPRVVYLAGLVAERKGDPDAAIGHYRRAAELLLYGQRRRWEVQ
ncbi:MAG: redoxin domain-containing protein [Planctomycetota bacterium]